MLWEFSRKITNLLMAVRPGYMFCLIVLVAVLVAVLKLGDMVEVSVGPGLLAFTSCVFLSLLAAASFDPHSFWEPEP